MADTATSDSSSVDLGTLINQASGGKGGDIGAMTSLVRGGLQAQDAKDKDPNIIRVRQEGETRLKQDEKLVDSAYAGIEPLGDRVKPWDAKKELADRTTSPFETFGSAGAILGVAASLFTHTPAVNAMNALSGAINAVKANDEKAYQTAYDAWKENTHLALERHEAEYKDFSAAMEKAKSDPAMMQQELAVYSAKYDDKIAAAHNALGDYATLETVKNAQNSAALQWAEARPKIEAEHEKAVLAFGMDKEWADSQAGQQFFASPQGQQWKKANPNKVAPDDVHAMNYYHAQKTATDASSPYSASRAGTPVAQYLAKLAAEQGSPLTAEQEMKATADFNKGTSTKTQSPIAMYMAAAQKDAESQGQPWGPNQIAEATQKFGRDSKGSLSDAGAQFVVDQYLSGDRQAIVGFARNPADKEKLTNMIADTAKARGITGPMLSVMGAEFQGLVTGERTLGTRTAQLGLASGELQAFIPQALEASKKVDRTNFPSANYAIQAFQNQEGDPELRAFGASLNAMENAYSQIISRGAVATDADKAAAHALVSTIDSPAVLQAVTDQIMRETQGASQAPSIVRDEYKKGFLIGRGGSPEMEPQQQPAGAGQSPFSDHPDAKKAPDGKWYVKQGDKYLEVVQ